MVKFAAGVLDHVRQFLCSWLIYWWTHGFVLINDKLVIFLFKPQRCAVLDKL